MRRRDFVRASAGLGLSVGLYGVPTGLLAQQPAAPAQGRAGGPPVPPVRKVKTTPLFRSPEGHPNAIAVAAEGLWIAEQKSDTACLVDWDGRLLKTVKTESTNTSGMGYGGGFLWMGANAAPRGIFQTDLNSRTVSHRQIPLGPPGNGGGCHGVMYHEGKLWITALRLRGILRVDAMTWTPEFLIPYDVQRSHATAWDKGAIWMVAGTGTGVDQRAGLIKYDAETGRVIETAAFSETDADPHGLAVHEDVLYSCDAGIHPGWPENKSPASGYIFRIDLT